MNNGNTQTNGESLFSDINVENDMKKAKNALYRPHSEIDKFNTQIEHAINGLEELMKSVSNSYYSIEDNSDASANQKKNIKENMDKVAFLIDKFVKEFKPIYEQTYAIYTAEKLAGNYDKESVVQVDWGRTYMANTRDSYITPEQLKEISSSLNKALNRGWNQI